MLDFRLLVISITTADRSQCLKSREEIFPKKKTLEWIFRSIRVFTLETGKFVSTPRWIMATTHQRVLCMKLANLGKFNSWLMGSMETKLISGIWSGAFEMTVQSFNPESNWTSSKIFWVSKFKWCGNILITVQCKVPRLSEAIMGVVKRANSVTLIRAFLFLLTFEQSQGMSP